MGWCTAGGCWVGVRGVVHGRGESGGAESRRERWSGEEGSGGEWRGENLGLGNEAVGEPAAGGVEGDAEEDVRKGDRAAALLLEVLQGGPEVLGELGLCRRLVRLRGRASEADVLVEVGLDARVEGRELPVQLRVDHGALLRVRGVHRLDLVLVADVAPD